MIISRELIDQGYISEKKHPECDYYIYNYTPKTQYERFWNERTMQCRGLILDGQGNVIARPFKKFFNLEEYAENSHLGLLPAYKNFNVYEKLDGSLGILYRMPTGEWRIATRGSFTSEQAKVGTEILQEKYSKVNFLFNWTFLFEIIYPQNRIVVDYGQTKELVLLTVIDNNTGNEVPYNILKMFAQGSKIPLVKRYDSKQINLENLKTKFDSENREGFVIQFDHGLRVKMKYEEYVRLHKILTGVSTKTVWELLKNNQPLDQIIDKVPDEFYNWFNEQVQKLKMQYHKIYSQCTWMIAEIPDLTTAEKYGILAKVAKEIKEHPYAPVIFAMWRDKPYKQIIWKMIRPKYQQPFKTEV